jgi:hypothetical protein
MMERPFIRDEEAKASGTGNEAGECLVCEISFS